MYWDKVEPIEKVDNTFAESSVKTAQLSDDFAPNNYTEETGGAKQ